MTAFCPAPDSTVGVAVRLSTYLDCQARVLGENGYLALVGGPLGASTLLAVTTIFVALIGYRFILGSVPSLQEGIGWTARLGIALALLASWPAFQTLIYRVVTDGPQEVAASILPASGLPSEDVIERIQSAYDTIRLGSSSSMVPGTLTSSVDLAAASLAQRFQFQGAAPRSATAFLIATVGFTAAIRVAIGFMLAIGPIPIMLMIVGGPRALFMGWLRILTGTALAAVGTTIVAAIELLTVESELARLQQFRTGATLANVDPQALPAILVIFVMITAFVVFVSVRVAASMDFRASFAGQASFSAPRHAPAAAHSQAAVNSMAGDFPSSRRVEQPREAVVAEALVRASSRERSRMQAQVATVDGASFSPGTTGTQNVVLNTSSAGSRRGVGRRTRAARQRDRV